jgi:5-methylcytosine-specific restriction endonuclease McrA
MFSKLISYFKNETKHLKSKIKPIKKTKSKIKPVKKTKYVKKKIPKALREQVWINKMGKNFIGTCRISWCENDMSCFNFDCGHNIPESKGGPTNISNLIPICRNCNIGMGNRFTIDEWEKKYEGPPPTWYNLNYWAKNTFSKYILGS